MVDISNSYHALLIAIQAMFINSIMHWGLLVQDITFLAEDSKNQLLSVQLIQWWWGRLQ